MTDTVTTQTQDIMIKFKSTKKVISKKGSEGLQLSMAQDQVKALLTELQKLQTNDRGVKLSVYVTKKQTEDGREFESGIAFVSAIREFGAAKKTNVTYTPKSSATPTTNSIKDRIQKLKSEV